MAKPTSLTPDTLASQPTPAAATAPRRAGRVTPRLANDTPMQIRVPRPEARAIKVAAAQSDRSISQFMLDCFHAYMQQSKTSQSGNEVERRDIDVAGAVGVTRR
jgi:hypothetical protein